jgi:hypothetical protein
LHGGIVAALARNALNPTADGFLDLFHARSLCARVAESKSDSSSDKARA